MPIPSQPLFHKIHYYLVSIPFPPAITPAAYIGRHDHNLKYVIPKATTDVLQVLFLPTNYKNLESSTWTRGRNKQPIYIQRGCSTSHPKWCSLLSGPTCFENKGMFVTRTEHILILLCIEIKHLLVSPWHPSLTHNMSSSRDSFNWAAERDYHFKVQGSRFPHRVTEPSHLCFLPFGKERKCSILWVNILSDRFIFFLPCVCRCWLWEWLCEDPGCPDLDRREPRALPVLPGRRHSRHLLTWLPVDGHCCKFFLD